MQQHRLLIAEDEALVSMALVEMLEELGYKVHATSTLETALEAAISGQYVAALVNLHLHGKTVEPVAEALRERGIVFAIASGMDADYIGSAFENAPLLKKPYLMEDITTVLERLIGPQAAAKSEGRIGDD